jgi:acid phosphatase
VRPLASPLAAALALTLAACSASPRSAVSATPAVPAAPTAVMAPVEPLAPASGAPAASSPADPLDALAWYQTAEESHRLAQSVFAAASRALEAALADPTWSALGQGAEAVALPPAVITDIDETLLDNSALQARFLLDGTRYTPAAFSAWVESAEAVALPGALDFARLAAARGVTLFYVTGRKADEEPGTRRNLLREGFALPDEPDVVLTRGERPEWGSDKESRRQDIARSYRVLLLLGDDLSDFVAGSRDATPERRRELASAVESRWGTSWFLLPNPLYGSWERALLGAQPGALSPEEVRARKRAALRRFAGALPPP